MKSVIWATLILILIIVISAVSVGYVNGVSEEMLQSLYRNEKYVAKNNWEYAESEANYVIELWQKNRIPMSIIFNHSVIEGIDKSIEKIKNIVILKEKGSFLYEKSHLSLLVEQLMEQQKISIGNIL